MSRWVSFFSVILVSSLSISGSLKQANFTTNASKIFVFNHANINLTEGIAPEFLSSEEKGYKAALERVYKLSKKHKAATVLTHGGDHYNDPGPIPRSKVNYYVYSENGDHNIKFQKAKIIVFAGGNLQWCLCEFTRDALRGLEKNNNKEYRFIFVKDAIYGGGRALPNLTGKTTESEKTKAGESVPFSERVNFFKKVIINPGSHFCGKFKKKNLPNHKKFSADDYSFIVIDGENVSKRIGRGKKEIKIELVASGSLDAVFSGAPEKSLESRKGDHRDRF